MGRARARLGASMRIAVIGTGKIGGTLGGRWRAAGHDVVYGSRTGSGEGPGGAPLMGVGEALVKASLDVARSKGVQIVELQSGRGPNRAAAHRLYERLGFKIRDSDLFRIVLE